MKDEHAFPARTNTCLLSLKEVGEGDMKPSLKKQHEPGTADHRGNAIH